MGAVALDAPVVVDVADVVLLGLLAALLALAAAVIVLAFLVTADEATRALVMRCCGCCVVDFESPMMGDGMECGVVVEDFCRRDSSAMVKDQGRTMKGGCLCLRGGVFVAIGKGPFVHGPLVFKREVDATGKRPKSQKKSQRVKWREQNDKQRQMSRWWVCARSRSECLAICTPDFLELMEEDESQQLGERENAKVAPFVDQASRSLVALGNDPLFGLRCIHCRHT